MRTKTKTNKSFAPRATGLGSAVVRAAMTLLLAVLTMTAWAVAIPQFPIYEGDEGTEAAPYQIKTIDDLNKLAADVNSNTTYYGKYFKLMNDLSFTYTTAWDDAESTESNFTPIGKGVYFQGHFDGNGMTIRGLRIYGSNTTETGWGLFGRTLSAEVKNITLADARITGCAYTGGIVGSNQGTVTNCHVGADVTIVANSSNTGYGGIVGHNYNGGTVSHCTSAVKMTLAPGMTPGSLGGIVGRNESTGPYTTLTDNFVIGAVIPAARSNMHAAIATDVCTSSYAHYRYERNYYRDCTVAGTANATDVGIASYYSSTRISLCDVNTDADPDGAMLVYALTLAQEGNIISDEALLEQADSIAADNSAAVYGGTVYIRAGSTVTLNIQETLTYTYCVTDDVTGERIWLADGQFTMPANDVTVTLTPDMTWATLKSAVAAGGTVMLTGNVKRDAKETIEIDKDVVLDLNGYTVYGYAPGSSEHYLSSTLFDVLSGGRLTVTDSGTGGRITNVDFCAISIEGESAQSNGSLTLSAGAISNALTAVEIKDYGKFTMTGGSITGNEYGVIIDPDATFTVSGNVNITGNTLWNILFDSLLQPNPIYIGGTLASTARIGIHINSNLISNFTHTGLVWSLTSGLPGRGTKQNFVLNVNQGLALVIPASGELAIAADTWRYNMNMGDNADNSADIANHHGETVNATLSGRTLYKDGSWNTLCLPFSVDLTATDCPLYGATARTVTAASVSGSTLNLTFGDAVNTLEAGTPYIIKWGGDGTSNIENPVFEGVTIDATKHDYDTNAESVTTDERVRFCGTYKSTAFGSEDKSILLMGSENTLFYPTTGAGIGSFRAYFKIGGDDSALLARRLTSFSIDFGEGEEEATGIVEVEANTSLSTLHSSLKDAWHTLDGRRLQGKPTQGGIYIKNGKKITVK